MAPEAPAVRAAITGSHGAFRQKRTPRPFCLRRRSRPRCAAVATPGSRPAPALGLGELRDETPAQPRLPHAGRGLEATPPSPRPPRIRHRSDTRSTRPTPGHVSSSRAGRSLSTKQRGLGRSRGPPGPDRARPTAGPRAEAAVTKRLLCRPARPRCGGRNRPRPPRRPRRTAPEAPGSSGSRKPRFPAANPWPHRNPGLSLPTAGRHRPATGPQSGPRQLGTHPNCGSGRRGADTRL